MTKYLLILFATIFFMSCGGADSPEVSDSADSTVTAIDTLVSDVDWGDDNDVEEESNDSYSYSSDNSSSSSSSGSSGGGGGAADSDADVIKYQNWMRDGDSPQDFGKALIYPAIRMVYSDNFAKPRCSVLNSTQDGDRMTIDLQITWKDHWVPKYMIKGTLEVNSDGSDATFVINDKNVDAEVLELTEDNTQNQINLASL